MVRTSLLSLASLVLMGVVPSPAEEPKSGDTEGFRVYSVTGRCQTRWLLKICESPREAFRVAAEHRAKLSSQRVEVTTGSEGKQLPAGRPVLYQVYTMVCEKSGWEKQAIVADEKKVEEVVKAHKRKGDRVEVVHDYAPKEAFHIYGGGCRRSWRLLGTYVTVEEACDAAEVFRTKDNFRCDVTTGTRGQDPYRIGSPSLYKVYARGCKGGWSVEATTTDVKKAQDVVEARKKKGSRVEIVQHFKSK